MKIIKPSAELISCTPDPEILIERAGRTCYKSNSSYTNETAAEFIRMILKRGHLSVIEHASATIKFICDRGVSHEMVRHRLASYSQESTRYCNYGKEQFGSVITVVKPPNLKTKKDEICWSNAMQNSQYFYMELIENGISPQIARSVLPNSLKTEIVMTANFREWLHFFNLRCSKIAHPQMREVALMALELLFMKSPTVFRDLAEKYQDDLSLPKQYDYQNSKPGNIDNIKEVAKEVTEENRNTSEMKSNKTYFTKEKET